LPADEQTLVRKYIGRTPDLRARLRRVGVGAYALVVVDGRGQYHSNRSQSRIAMTSARTLVRPQSPTPAGQPARCTACCVLGGGTADDGDASQPLSCPADGISCTAPNPVDYCEEKDPSSTCYVQPTDTCSQDPSLCNTCMVRTHCAQGRRRSSATDRRTAPVATGGG
jgi:hypothetical protein